MRMAKTTGCAVFLVGHVTKEGAIAGPRVLEHMVDVVLYFEGDRQHEYRILRAVKNRFGSVNELGLFEMRESGMVPVENPSELLLSTRARNVPGSCVHCAIEGSRPMLVDVQALALQTAYGTPRRTTNGFDAGRLALLLAVLEKRAGVSLFNQDVYVNVAGGLELSEPAADLPLCAAVASSVRDAACPGDWAVIGEIGLAGEIRAVSQAERRLAECARLGFTTAVIPRENARHLPRAGRHAGLRRGNAGRSAGDSVRIKSNGIGRTNDGRSLCADLRKSVAGGARRASVFLSLQLCYTKKEEYMI